MPPLSATSIALTYRDRQALTATHLSKNRLTVSKVSNYTGGSSKGGALLSRAPVYSAFFKFQVPEYFRTLDGLLDA